MIANILKAKKRTKINKKKFVLKRFSLSKFKKIKLEKKETFSYLEVIVIMIMTLFIGGVLGFVVTFTVNKSNSSKDTAKIPDELKELVSTYYQLKDTYYKDLNEEELLNAGIKGMVDYLDDPYSTYMDTTTTKAFTETVEGKYTGIGSEIAYNSNKQVIISNPFENSPAKKAGLIQGDIILEVDKTSTTGMTLTEVANLIKGITGTKVTIKFQRNEETFTKEMTRDSIEIPSVTSTTYTKNDTKVGYIKISIFASNTYSQFSKALVDLEKENIQKLVIDVRDNSGGYLSSVTSIASLFLKKGETIYQLQTKETKTPVIDTTESSRSYEIAVLINNGSASASEILAGALQESYNAEVIGVNSYGKGTVQRTQTLESGATIKYTIQKWLTPKGNWINEVGITPTVKEELSNTYKTTPTVENDNQLQKALEVLSSKDSE